MAKDADAAVAAAWAAYKPEVKWPLEVVHDQADRFGWTKHRDYEYQTSPNERRDVEASTRCAGGRPGGATVFDFGEWKSEVGSRKNPDGSISFVTMAPGVQGFEFVVGAEAKRTLVVRDSQHQYVFEEQ